MRKLITVLMLLLFAELAQGQYYEIRLKVSDGFSHDTLRIGYDPTATNGIDQHLGEFELPPPPPTGIFDCRIFSDSASVPIGQGLRKDFRPGSPLITTTTYHKIKYQAGSGSTAIRITLLGYTPGAQGYQELKIQDFFGGVLVNTTFIGPDTGSVVVTNLAINALLLTLRVQNLSPVELSSFYYIITGNDVRLNWTTSAETNNRGFEIHRKQADEQDWSQIGFVSGKGNANALNEYSYDDRNVPHGRYNYRLKQIDINGNFEYFVLKHDVVLDIPNSFHLFQNFPNPFNPVTTISFQLSKSGDTKLKLFDQNGRLISILLDENLAPGFYNYELDGSGLSSGFYFYSLESNGVITTRSLVLLK